MSPICGLGPNCPTEGGPAIAISPDGPIPPPGEETLGAEEDAGRKVPEVGGNVPEGTGNVPADDVIGAEEEEEAGGGGFMADGAGDS